MSAAAETDPLPGLPGAALDPGTGAAVPTLFEGLLADAGPLAAHREHRAARYGDLLGPLVVPADGVEALQDELRSSDHALQVLLSARPEGADPGLEGLREARNRLLDDDRVEVVGVELPVPPGAVAAVLSVLDFSAPAWLELPLVAGWEEALDVVVEDGAEHVAVRADDPAAMAAFVRRAVDRDVVFRVAGPAREPGALAWLAVLCAVRAALNGAEAAEVAAVLAERRAAPLASALRRMSEADAAVARAFLAGVTVADVRSSVEDLVALGLLDLD